MFDTNLIKQRITCVDVAQRCGLPIQRAGDRCVSPLREDASNPTSFCVDDDFWYDFSDGRGGDAIDLLAELRHNGDRGAAIRELASITGVTDDNPHDSDWVAYTNHMNAMTAFYNSQLTKTEYDYLRSRGVLEEDADRLMIGRVTDGALKGRLFLPYQHANGYVCYYATRAMPGSAFQDNKYMKQKRDEYCQHIPWGMPTLNRSGNTLVIAEGMFDAISFEISGYPVLSAVTGFFSKSQIPMVLAAARRFSQVFIVYDDDSATSDAGAKFTRRMAELLTRNHIPFIVGTVPTPYHDISEYYAAGGSLKRIVDTAEPGIEYLALKSSTFEELESFVYSIARHTKRSRLDELFARLKSSGRWNDKQLVNLHRSATTAPPENIITDEILKSRQILYIPSIGFYEYLSGVWVRRPDEVIATYADRAYGEFSTAQRVRAITNLLKTRSLREDVVFDRQPLWNFINGTLELDTGNFRDHNPNDYCSIQVTYPYNPDAGYESWARFVDDITAGDPKSAEILQFIAGYGLFNDCSHEKGFVLSGNGSNGKSKYLEILRLLFSSVSGNTVTHMPPRAFLDKFQRIQLRDAIFNIAGEIRSDLRDVEEYMKSIISGEPQTACYKSKDYITFIPRTKLVFATNSQLSSEDTSDGLTRRLVLLHFPVTFCDNPDPNDPYQRRKDINIISSLTEELNSGGIFNWVYAGYKLLRTVGYFTETNDQAELIQEFKRSSNPVLVFWEECSYGYPDEFSNSKIYQDYCQWCSDNGERIMAARVFHREFKKLTRRKFEPYRTKTERGYRRVTSVMSPNGVDVTFDVTTL